VETPVLNKAVAEASGVLLAWLLLGAHEGLRINEVAAVRGEDFRSGQL
jgi:hypothetical protein